VDNLRSDTKVIFALALVHFIGDFYSSFINPLMPVFVAKYSLTLAQVGLLAGISRFLAFIVQPTVGYVADHYRTRFFVLGGPFLAIIFIPLVGIAPFYALLIFFVALGSIGSSMFHPTTAGMVSSYAGRHFGLSMSVFNMGGTLAFGVGPLFVTYLVERFGLGACPFTMVIGLLVMIFLFRVVPVPVGEKLASYGFLGSIKEAMGAVWKPIALIWTIMVLRSFVGQSFMTFVPVLYADRGFSLITIGAMVSLFTIAGAVSGLLAGHASDRIGFKPVFFVSHLLTVPCLYMLLYLPGQWVFVSVSAAGFFALATLPLGVAMAQELAPRGRSMVSSLMMGLAFGIGGMLSPLTGKLADLFSIQAVLSWLAVIPGLSLGLIAFLPGTRSQFKPSSAV
jgi:FSR family fosmidomycin resistance protein-like MFS transporter